MKVSESEDQLETGVYRHPKQVQGVREGYLDVEGKECYSLQQGFLAALHKYPNNKCMGSRKEGGKTGDYVFKTFQEVDTIVRQIGSGMEHLGLAPQLDTYQDKPLRFVAVYGKNSEDWI